MKEIQISHNRLELSHILFAGDMVLFVEANAEYITMIKYILDLFSRSFGQKVNILKSQICFSRCVEANIVR